MHVSLNARSFSFACSFWRHCAHVLWCSQQLDDDDYEEEDYSDAEDGSSDEEDEKEYCPGAVGGRERER